MSDAQQTLFESVDIDVTLIRSKMRDWLDRNPVYVVFAPSNWFSLEEAAEAEWGPWAYAGISVYKTARGALKAAGPYGVLVQLDFEQLRIVDASESLVTKGDSRNEIGDSEFCERQAVLWMQRADQLRAAGK